ncbi:LysR family transcriptional regulator [Ideonella sp.]|uniref:LysR family transcriptional regulator n=1 Tax=Ideonella sp. TaxID=1929293 RepID=UPI0035AE8B52
MPTKRIPLSHLDWDDLRVFHVVAEARSFMSAARTLGMNQSTVTRRVAHLEATVGGALFTRHRLGTRVNALGKSLLPHVEKMGLGAREFTQALAGTKSPDGQVRLASTECVASVYLAPRMEAFAQLCPGIDLDLITSAEVVNVERRAVDIYLSPVQLSGRGQASERIGGFSFVLCAGQRYLDARGRPESVADLRHHHFVSHIDDVPEVGRVRWPDNLVDQPSISFRSNSTWAQMNAAVAGAGLALLPKCCLQHRTELVPLLENEIDIGREVWATVHHENMYLPRIKKVMSFLRQTFRQA